MNRTATRFVRFGAGLLALVILGWILTGYAKPGEQEMPYHEGVPTDWSHSHVIFSKPASDDEARELGKDPRYWQQLYRRELRRNVIADPGREISQEVEQAAGVARSGGLWEEDLGKGAAPGAGNYPAKYGFSLTTANCASAATPDYIVYSTGLQGSGTQASIVAYDNVYKGCTGTVPTTYWAYNSGGLILTSPVISLDGTQIAFVQTSSSLTAALVLLKWKSSATETVTSPGVPTSVSASTYRTCVAPCMTEIFLADANGVEFDDRTSSLFYDFKSDVGWVGGATGWLVELTGLFTGKPAEVTTGGFPAHLNPSNPTALSSPVYDHKSQNVFVGDAGGYLYRVASSNGVTVKSAEVDFGAGLLSGPLLDQTNGFLYVFSSSDGTANCTGGTACSAVFTFGTNFASGSSGAKTTVGQSLVKGAGTPNPLYIGALDSAYYNSVGGTGNMYVCGGTGIDPLLYRVPITAGALGTAVSVVVLTPAADAPSCSPVTDFQNSNVSASQAELVFFSVQSHGRPCTGGKGCLINFVSLPWQPKTAYTKGQEILILNTTKGAFYIQTATTSGTSGTTAPAWPLAVGQTTTDGSVTWVNQGTTTLTALTGWTANQTVGLQSRITDGTNVQITVQAGKTGTTAPVWNTAPGGQTTDNQVIWRNAGPWPTSSLTLTGGAGGVIIDNTATSAGGSQIYFFTLGNNPCTTSGGTGGCAMQASQSSLN